MIRKVDSNEAGRILLLAEQDGDVAGCAIAGLSNFGGKAFIAVRVLPAFRRQGIGRALFDVCAAHARSLGRDGVNAFVYAGKSKVLTYQGSLP